MDSNSEHRSLSPGKGLIILVCIVIGVGAYIGLGMTLGIAPLYAGFAFSLYFGGMKGSDPRELPAAVIGSLGGLLTAALLHLLPQQFGTAGLVVVLALILAAIYALVMQWATILVNNAFMLLLTIGTIPPVQAAGDFTGMAFSVLLAGAMMGLLLLVGGVMATRAKKTAGAV